MTKGRQAEKLAMTRINRTSDVSCSPDEQNKTKTKNTVSSEIAMHLAFHKTGYRMSLILNNVYKR